MTITVERAESLADILMQTASALGSAIRKVDQFAREGAQAITDEEAAYVTLIEQGEQVMVAMRVLAMRLDRAALVKHGT